MDTELLRTFLEVHHTRHFARAAENLFVTPSTVTARIQQLESLLGSPLFVRSRNNLQLTEAGNRLLPNAQSMLTLWQKVRQEVGEGNAISMLSLATTHTLWEVQLRPLLGRLQQTLPPNCRFKCQLLSSHQLIQQLLQGLLDLVILHEPPTLADIEMHSVGEMELLLYADQVQQHALDCLQQGYAQVEWGERFMREFQRLYPGVTPAQLQLDPSLLAIDWILTNGGSAYLPRAMAEPYREQGRLFAANDAEPIRLRCFALYRSDNPHLPLIQQLLRGIRGEGD